MRLCSRICTCLIYLSSCHLFRFPFLILKVDHVSAASSSLLLWFVLFTSLETLFWPMISGYKFVVTFFHCYLFHICRIYIKFNPTCVVLFFGWSVKLVIPCTLCVKASKQTSNFTCFRMHDYHILFCVWKNSSCLWTCSLRSE